MSSVKQDSIEIIRRWRERNPDILELIKDEVISLEDFAEIVITQFEAFNPRTGKCPDCGSPKRETNKLKPNKNVKAPKYVYLTEGYNPDKLPK